MSVRYQIDNARDDLDVLREVIEQIATRPNHLRIISVTWRQSAGGMTMPSGYVIVSETQ